MNQRPSQILWIAGVVLGVILLWFASVIIHLERYRYANQVHLCYEQGVDYVVDADAYFARENCLDTAKPRTSGLWDLYYALSGQ